MIKLNYYLISSFGSILKYKANFSIISKLLDLIPLKAELDINALKIIIYRFFIFESISYTSHINYINNLKNIMRSNWT